MSQANYELWYLDDIGNRLAYITDAKGFDYTKVLGGIGSGSITIPKRGQVYDNQLPDRRIAFYIQPEGGSLSLDYVMQTQQFTTTTSREGQYQNIIDGDDFNGLLSRRITAFYTGKPEVKQTGTIDDIMKEVVRDSFVDNADYSGTPSPSRSLSGVGFSVQANASAAASVTMAFSWKNCLAVLQNLQAASKAAGNEVFFIVEPTSERTMQFRTWIGGVDRTVTTGNNPIVFSLEWGNLVSPALSNDFGGSANFIYGGGRNNNTDRKIETASDTDRINSSQFGRRESFAFSNGETFPEVLVDAENELERKRPKKRLTATIQSTPLTPYGGINGWNVGTLASINYAGEQYDILVRSVHVKVSGDGKLDVRGRVESI